MTDLTPGEIARLNEYGEADAWANFYRCAPEEFTRSFRVAAHRVGSIWVTLVSGVDSAFFNRISCLGVSEPVTEAMLDDAIAILQAAGCNSYMAPVSPLARPEQLPAWLERRGFVTGGNWAKVYRGNDTVAAAPTGLRIASIGVEEAPAFARITASAFEMTPELGSFSAGFIGQPGWQAYLAYDGDQPVSAAGLFVSGGVGWLGFGSTLDSHRKRGGQSALFTRRLQDGLALGCRWFVTETGEDTPQAPNPSYHNMLRAGFKLAYLRRNYLHPDPVSQ